MTRVAHGSGRRGGLLASVPSPHLSPLLVGETPYTLVAFMFLGQPLLAVAVGIFGWEAVRDLRHTKVLKALVSATLEPSALRLAVAAFGGLAVGIEREWSASARRRAPKFAGVRTFLLLA